MLLFLLILSGCSKYVPIEPPRLSIPDFLKSPCSVPSLDTTSPIKNLDLIMYIKELQQALVLCDMAKTQLLNYTGM